MSRGMLSTVTPCLPGEMCTSMIVSVLFSATWPTCQATCWCLVSEPRSS